MASRPEALTEPPPPAAVAPERKASLLSVFRESFDRWLADDVPRRGAALSYYTIFSIAPLMLIALTVVGAVLGADAAQGLVSDKLAGVLGRSSAQVIENMIASAQASGSGTAAGVIGVVVLLFGASAVVGELQDSLMVMWGTVPKKGGLWLVVRNRLLSIAFVLGIGFIMLVSLMINAGAAAAGRWFENYLPIPEAVFHVVNALITLGLITTVFGLIFKILPRARIAWSDVSVGAGFTALLFTVGNVVLGLYLGKAAPTSMYGAAGSLLGFLLWTYYCAQILYFGAEFTRVYAERRGSGFLKGTAVVAS